jgi:indole-3-glycerol phosphate synthase
MTVHRFLETILAKRRLRVEEDKVRLPASDLEIELPPLRREADAAAKIREKGAFIIAEIKRASPSRGIIAPVVDVAARSRAYERGGAGAVSVLCEPDFFLGSLDDLEEAARAVAIPVLCKDFVVDPYQLLQARRARARWVLLIARILGDQLPALTRNAEVLGLEPLVEVHSEAELDLAVGAGARLIGVNARDLDTFEVDKKIVERLAPLVPSSCACIAESGIHSTDDLLALRDAGAHGFLIGEALMRTADPEAFLSHFKAALSTKRGCAGASKPVAELRGPMC